MTVEITVVEDYEPCLDLRRAVFIGEQGINEADEWDDLDEQSTHLLATLHGEPVGTARVYREGDVGRIGRICVAETQRRAGLGAALVEASLDQLRQMPGLRAAKLSAQVQAQGFYTKFGFETTGSIYDDAGIPHRDMVLGF